MPAPLGIKTVLQDIYEQQSAYLLCEAPGEEWYKVLVVQHCKPFDPGLEETHFQFLLSLRQMLRVNGLPPPNSLAQGDFFITALTATLALLVCLQKLKIKESCSEVKAEDFTQGAQTVGERTATTGCRRDFVNG